MPKPPVTSYPYNQILRYNSNIGSVLSGATAVGTSVTIQFDQHPKMLYIYARRRNQDLLQSNGFIYSDTFARINQISVQYNNQSGVFGNYSVEDLWEMSCKNGLQDSFSQFKNITGSVVGINPVSDIGLSAIESSGSGKQISFNVQVNIQNISSQTINYDLYVVIINEGIFSLISPSTAISNTAVLTPEAVFKASTIMPEVTYDEVVHKEGGSIFGKLKSTLNVGSKVAKELSNVGRMIAPQYTPAFDTLGRTADVVSKLTGSAMSGGRRRRYKLRGGALIGA